MIRLAITSVLLITMASAAAQTQAAQAAAANDTAAPKVIYMKEVTVVGRGSNSDIHQLPEIVGTNIFAGKKNGLIVMDNLNANVSTNNMRQVMAKVPGIHIWESDGSGIQIGIATRGLSPNRSWEFNMRQNGYDIASDPFGYPEAYYTPQLQAVQRIQVVKGAGGLQYGPQFGGMINFVLRNGSDLNKKFEFETQQTAGSFGLFNSYNAVGGKTERLHYYAFFDHRSASGWRQNSSYTVNTGFATVSYKLTPKLKLGAELMLYEMKSQQPGGLTDSLFKINAQQSFRSRNWFNIPWSTAAVNLDYSFADNRYLNVKVFSLWGDRNSIGYLRAINIADTISKTTLAYNNRTIDIDKYRNYGVEARYLSDYTLLGKNHTLSAGLRYFRGNTSRLKNGKGDAGSGFNIDLQEPSFPQDLALNTDNVAAFAETVIRPGKHFILIPGIRYEHIQTIANGRLKYNTNGTEDRASNEKRKRGFVLLGIGAEYHIGATEMYANYSQSYRPMLFSDLTASPTTDIIDTDLKDARGYSIDLGYRGKLKDYLFFDAGIFFMQYNNRIGTLAQQRPDGSFYNLRTNVGNSTSKGVEALAEFNPVRAFAGNSKWGSVSVFAAYSFTDARYDRFRVVVKNGNQLSATSLDNKFVENAPQHILRAGITYSYRGFSVTGQLSHVSKTFADANNTETPSANGQNGLIPAYTVSDISINYKLLKQYNIRAGINNITDVRYFTRRGGGYPGPGLLPADARNFYLSVGARL
jgi:Fe(3+) dicitrate transport protein